MIEVLRVCGQTERRRYGAETKELASEDAGGGWPPASPHTCRQMLWRPESELANNHPHVPARRSRRNTGPGTVRAADCWPGSKPDLHHPLSQARVQLPKETSCELGKDDPVHVRVWTAGGDDEATQTERARRRTESEDRQESRT